MRETREVLVPERRQVVICDRCNETAEMHPVHKPPPFWNMVTVLDGGGVPYSRDICPKCSQRAVCA